MLHSTHFKRIIVGYRIIVFVHAHLVIVVPSDENEILFYPRTVIAGRLKQMFLSITRVFTEVSNNSTIFNGSGLLILKSPVYTEESTILIYVSLIELTVTWGRMKGRLINYMKMSLKAFRRRYLNFPC